MALSIQQFIENLSQTGLMSAAEVSAISESLPAEQRPTDVETLAKLLIRRGKLTKYQAQVIYSGKHKNLVFGEYVVLDKLGAGGMGVVLKARHRRMDRVVAIKVLPTEALNSAAAVERFYREVKAAARLLHPNIVAAFDAGEHDGMHYLVMEYVDGRDLSQIVAENGPLPVAEAVECVIQAARGLEFAHAMGIVHRDIKPGNLLLSKDGQVKILDMGLALLGETAPADMTTAAQLTRSGQVMGTVDYMSPEQAQHTHQADARSDLYSLGCTLWRLLTGEPIYIGDSLMNRMLAHQRSPIPSLRERRADVPEALDVVFQKMVAKRPDDRYQTAAQVIQALRTSLVGDRPTLQTSEESSSGGSLTQLAERQGSPAVAVRPGTSTSTEDTLSRQVEETNTATPAGNGNLERPGKHIQAHLPRRRKLILLAGSVIACAGLAAFGWWLFGHGSLIGRGTENRAGSQETNGPPVTAGTAAGQEWDGNCLKMKFCWCPAGPFTMGSPKDDPGRLADMKGEARLADQVEVTLSHGFWMGKFEVTQEEWQQLVGTTVRQHRDKTNSLMLPGEGPRYPIYYVNYPDVTEFCRQLNERERQAGRLPDDWEYRLPTEAQWEYACRAGSTTRFSFGDDESLLEKYAWYEKNSGNRSHEVGEKPANAWGLHDMLGNVEEWCRDGVANLLPGGTDPEITEQTVNRRKRGGSWMQPGDRAASAYRLGHAMTIRHAAVGFRVALVQLFPQPKKPSVPVKKFGLGERPGDEWDGSGPKMKFCWCPPGNFKMGEGMDAADVQLTRGFWLGKYEVTQAEYRAVMKSNPSHFSTRGAENALVAGRDTDKFPVEWVGCAQADDFCRVLTEGERSAGRLPVDWAYTLPTEAQWEYACRAGTRSAYSFGDSESALSDYGWHTGNAEKRTHEVGQKKPNPWGLYDMHGNVWEWCRDWYQEKLPGGRDPEVVEQASRRMARGGSWFNEGKHCQSAFRGRYVPGMVYFHVGFRIALVQVP